MEYRETLNLPKTDFPMRAKLPEREPKMQEMWAKEDVYGQLRKARAGQEKFVLHDGPPYANGAIHIGTALNKVLKDIVVRFASMEGHDSPYVPGWDTHGLPIELRAMRDLDLERSEVSALRLRQYCHEFALRWQGVQEAEFKRLGVMGDWDNPYLTLHPAYEACQIKVFGEMFMAGHIYKGLRPVYWCADCQTALAEAEIEYENKDSNSIYVGFPLVEEGEHLPADAMVVIWTTTPWTIPANMAICLHPDAEYQLVDTEAGPLLLAKELREQALAAMGLTVLAPGPVWKGRELEGVRCRHPLFARDSVLILGDHVTLDEGTGCVHTAPGHGHEDFMVAQRYDLEVLNPLDDKGVFTDEAGAFAGLGHEQANPHIIKALESRNALLGAGEMAHQYPHCWRCKKPVIYRATKQWFASIDGFRERALAAIETVQWIPPWGRERIRNMVRDRGDWCISRQRVWGVPIPAFYCTACEAIHITDDSIEHIATLFETEGSDAWFRYDVDQLLPPGTRCCECGHKEFTKESDIMDVWFDSGSSHAAVLRTHSELCWPAQIYLEGSDQHRGWFQSSLLTAVATAGTPPYRSVLTHGFVVDGQGRKMSKSLGNVVAPQEVMNQYGADILRLWVASADYKQDIRLSPAILKQLAEVYRKIRNSLRFALGNLYDFDPDQDAVEYEGLFDMDRWGLLSLERMLEQVTRHYRSYDFHLLYHAIHNFCTIDMSSVYFDVTKDRLYTEPQNSRKRRAAQTVLYRVVDALVRIIAPVMPHTADEVWRLLPNRECTSVALALWPETNPQYRDAELEERWRRLLKVRSSVSKALELARDERIIGSSLAAHVKVLAPGEWLDWLLGVSEDLSTLFIVSAVEVEPLSEANSSLGYHDESLGLRILVDNATGEKCERCWNFSDTVGEDQKHSTLCRRCWEVLDEGGEAGAS